MTNSIITYITQEQIRQRFYLAKEEEEFLAETLITFVTEAVRKYIEGAIEHEDDSIFLTDVSHLDELYKEQIDSLMYLSAAIKLKREQQIREAEVREAEVREHLSQKERDNKEQT